MALLDVPSDGRTDGGGEVGMTKREKILMALSICLPNTEDDAEKDCRDCPYWVCGDMVSIPVRLIEDMRNFLEAQEPRVMTLDEIGNALKMPLWKETKRAHKDLYTGWVLAYDIQKGLGITGTRLGMSEPSGRVVWYGLDDYGKTWRCWTSAPSDEVRRATPWN